MKVKSYQFPDRVKIIVCCDLDETFLPFRDENKKDSGISELESYFLNNMGQKSIIFGWITGSNLESALRKTEKYIAYYPHFIASSLGTEFHWIVNSEIHESEIWNKNILESGYKKSDMNSILNELDKEGIKIVKEPDDYQGKYKSTFYYYIKGNPDKDFATIQRISKSYNTKVLFNRSNPAAGDPENCYDIEFIPSCCGKGEVVDFLMEELKLSPENVYCFGDSFNDFSMFERTKNSFLVGNADPMAKEKYPNVLKRNYCFGVKDKLEELIK